MNFPRRTLIVSLLWLLGGGLALWVYLQGCAAMWPTNKFWGEDDDAKTYDQKFYIKTAWDLCAGYADRADYVPRSRMPAYPWLLHLFLDTNRPEPEQFDIFKRLNITLSGLALVGVGILSVRRLGAVLGAGVVLATAWTVFVFKAVLVQPEISFYFLYFVLFLCMIGAFRRPGWRWAIALGAGAGLTHLVKGSALPNIAWFLVLLGGLALGRAWQQRKWTPLAAPACFLGAFLAVTGLYLVRSWAAYGSPVYSPHSRYYFLADSAEESYAMEALNLSAQKPALTVHNLHSPRIAHYLETKWLPDPVRRAELEALVQAAGEDGEVILEGAWDILPTAGQWWRTHGWREAVDRLWNGFFDEEQGIWPRNVHHRNGYFWYLQAFGGMAIGSGLLMLVLKPTVVKRDFRANVLPILWAAGSLGISLLFYAWWAPVSDRNRFFLTLYLPLLMSAGMLIRWASLHLDWRSLHLPVLPLLKPLPLVCGAILILPLYRDAQRLLELDEPINKARPERTKAALQLPQ